MKYKEFEGPIYKKCWLCEPRIIRDFENYRIEGLEGTAPADYPGEVDAMNRLLGPMTRWAPGHEAYRLQVITQDDVESRGWPGIMSVGSTPHMPPGIVRDDVAPELVERQHAVRSRARCFVPGRA
ncbi:hypothetical protein GW17_00009045 [Ensete ventricosum]|nr:hypothetical protein GW17_00009045 [Ensete ventricosum]